MNTSSLFRTDIRQSIERKVASLLNAQPDFLSAYTATSTRAVGDAIQSILCSEFGQILGDLCRDYSSDFARRAMADLAFTDNEGLYYVVDVKTHRLGTRFNMPNLTSVERLARFYKDDSNYFAILLIEYAVAGTSVDVRRVHFVPIEFLAWSCLTVGALGWGQIQIANASVVSVNDGYSRREWMIELCDVMISFYPREIRKIEHRMDYFVELRQQWDAKPEA